MIIGIDASALPPQPVGAGNYIIHLVRVLAALKSEDEFTVFAQSGGRELIALSEETACRWVIVPNMKPAVRLVWEQTLFPRLVSQSRVELLHSLHYTRPIGLPCASVVTFHDMTFFLYPRLHTRAKRIFFQLAMQISARRADALIADSESTRQDAIRLLGIPPQKIYTALLGVDDAYRPISDQRALEAVRLKYNLPPDFILYVGLVEPRKNLPLLIRAFRKLIDLKTETRLVIAGRLGWMYTQVVQLIETLGVKDKVSLIGYVPTQDLPLVYNLASVFVYPTLYEGFGLPVLEAMACGVPVVTTEISSLPEIIDDAGILVPANDEAALTLAIQSVLTDRALSRRLAILGLERASQFTWERTAQQTLQVYRNVLRAD